MFVGHYSAALAARAMSRPAPLWSLLAAAQLLDIGWATLVMAGLEHVEVDPKLPGNAFVLADMPWTHSLPAALVWSGAAAVIAKPVLKLGWSSAIVLGGVVFSHWLLDFLVHRPDLALWPGGPKVGLGLWNAAVLEQAVEMGLLALAAMLWSAARRARGEHAWPGVVFLALLVAVQIIAMLMPADPSASPIAIGGPALAVYLVVIAIGVFLDQRPALGRLSP